jgi:hypothetical protein
VVTRTAPERPGFRTTSRCLLIACVACLAVATALPPHGLALGLFIASMLSLVASLPFGILAWSNRTDGTDPSGRSPRERVLVRAAIGASIGVALTVVLGLVASRL